MVGFRVGVEVAGAALDVRAAVSTLPWLTPDRIMLDGRRTLVVLTTATATPAEARTYAERRLLKAAEALELDLEILSIEVYPPVIDLRDAERRFGTRLSSDDLG